MHSGYPPQVVLVDTKGAERGFANPGGTVPFPPPSSASQPYGHWIGETQPLQWTAGAGQVVLTATWGTPTFDFRPELRGADSRESRGIPIWRPLGAGGQLFVHVGNLTAAALDRDDLVVSAIEYGHPWDSRVQAVQRITVEEDVTAELQGAKPSAILCFEPIGYPYPVRYWRLMLRFDIRSTPAANPPLAVSGAYY